VQHGRAVPRLAAQLRFRSRLSIAHADSNGNGLANTDSNGFTYADTYGDTSSMQ
jgi:hypothetical protein